MNVKMKINNLFITFFFVGMN